MALGALDIIIAADTAQLRKGMDTAVGIMQSSTKTMENVAKTAGTAIAGYFAFDSIKGNIQHTLDYADSLSKMSQKVGVSVDALYAMQAAGKLADVDLQTLEKSLLKFNKGLGSAQTGAGGTENALKNLGISLKDSSGHLKDSDKYLFEVADKFKAMPNGVAKSTLAMELFGKSGADMIPLLNGGADALREYSGILDQDTAQAAEKFNDSLTTVGLAVDAVYMQMISNLSPTLSAIADDFTTVSKDGKETGQTLGGEFAEGAKTAIQIAYGVAAAMTIAGHGIYNLSSAAVNFATGDFKKAKADWDNISKDFNSDIDSWGARMNKINSESSTGSTQQSAIRKQDLVDFEASEARKEAAAKKAEAAAKKSAAEKLKAQQEEARIQKGYLEAYADMEAKAAIDIYQAELDAEQYNHDVITKNAIDAHQADLDAIDDLAARQASYAVSLYDSITPDSEKIIAKYTSIFETMADMGVDTLTAFAAQMDEELSNVKSKMDFSASIQFDPSSMDGVAKSIAGMGKSLSLLMAEEDQYNKNKTKYAKGTAEYNLNEQEHTKSQIIGYSNLAGAMSTMFEQGSQEAQAMQAVQAGLALVEATLAVVHAGTSGDVYTAIPRMVATAAMVGSALSNIGTSFSSSSSGSSGASGGGIVNQNTIPYSGTVMGDSEAISESTLNIVNILDSIHVSEYAQLRDINRAVTSMASAITGTVTNMFRSGGGGFNPGDFNSSFISSQLKAQNSYFGQANDSKTSALNNLFGSYGENANMGLSLMKAASGITFAEGVANFLTKGLFGGGTSSMMISDRLNVGAQSAGSYLNGGQSSAGYQGLIYSSTDGGWLGSDSSSFMFTSKDASADLKSSLTMIYKSLSNTLLAVDEGLGSHLDAQIKAYTFGSLSIETMNKSSEQIISEMNNAFSSMGDQMITSVFGEILTQYQQLGEGLLETAVRVIVEKEVVLQDLANVNRAITGDVIGITQSLVSLSGGLTKFSDANSAYFENYFTDAEKSASYQKNLLASYDAMNLSMPTTIAGFRSLVDGLDLNTLSGRETYVELMNIADAQKQYMDSLTGLNNVLIPQDMNLSKSTDATSIFQTIKTQNDTLSYSFGEMIALLRKMLYNQQFGVQPI